MISWETHHEECASSGGGSAGLAGIEWVHVNFTGPSWDTPPHALPRPWHRLCLNQPCQHGVRKHSPSLASCSWRSGPWQVAVHRCVAGEAAQRAHPRELGPEGQRRTPPRPVLVRLPPASARAGPSPRAFFSVLSTTPFSGFIPVYKYAGLSPGILHRLRESSAGSDTLPDSKPHPQLQT